MALFVKTLACSNLIIFISRIFQVWSLHTKYFDAFNRLHETNGKNEGNNTWEISLDVKIRVKQQCTSPNKFIARNTKYSTKKIHNLELLMLETVTRHFSRTNNNFF